MELGLIMYKATTMSACRVLVALFVLLCFSVADAQAGATALLVDRVEVYKSRHELQLLYNDRVVKKYRVALGRRTGRKETAGDFKTPEGRYVIDFVKPNSQYHRALHISYPNETDFRQAAANGKRPGGDIMLHGLPDETPIVKRIHSLFDWTKGCLAVTNPEIEEIARTVKPGTPIIIFP